MALFSSHSNGQDIQRDIEALRRDVAALSRSVTKLGTSAWRDAANEASGVYDEMTQRINHALPIMRRHAHDLEETIRDNPGRSVALVGLAALALAATVLVLGNNRR